MKIIPHVCSAAEFIQEMVVYKAIQELYIIYMDLSCELGDGVVIIVKSPKSGASI